MNVGIRVRLLLFCLGIFVVYAVIAGVMDWKHGGGAVPTLILFAAIVGTMSAITEKGKEVMANGKRHVVWLLNVALLFGIEIVGANGNFVHVQLAQQVSIELPRNWTTISINQRITLDTWVQSKRELAGASSDLVSDLNFAANYYDDEGETAAIFNIRYYSDMELTQADSRAATKLDTQELDTALQAEMVPAMKQFGMTVLSWLGTEKQSINGIVAFVTEYKRASMQHGSPFQVRLVRVFNGERSFTITISYREDQGLFLRPICDRVIQSLRM